MEVEGEEVMEQNVPGARKETEENLDGPEGDGGIVGGKQVNDSGQETERQGDKNDGGGYRERGSQEGKSSFKQQEEQAEEEMTLGEKEGWGMKVGQDSEGGMRGQVSEIEGNQDELQRDEEYAWGDMEMEEEGGERTFRMSYDSIPMTTKGEVREEAMWKETSKGLRRGVRSPEIEQKWDCKRTRREME